MISEKKNPSTKDLILEALSTNLEATAKQTYNQVKHTKNLTYHAVFKFLNLMVQDGTLLKNERTYSLNPEWIKNTKEYFQRLEISYINRKESLMINKDTKYFILPSLHEGFFMLMRAINNGVFGESKIVIGHFSHLFYFFISKEEIALLKNLGKERKFYYLVKNKSFLDRIIAQYNKSTFNYMTKLGVNCAEPFQLYVIGDKLIQINLPLEIKEEMDKIYNQSFSRLLLPKPKINQVTTFINEIAHKEVKIPVHVITDKDTAKQITEKTLSYFNN